LIPCFIGTISFSALGISYFRWLFKNSPERG